MKSHTSVSPWPKWAPNGVVVGVMLAASLNPPQLDSHLGDDDPAFYAATEDVRDFKLQQSSTATDGIVDYAPSLSTRGWF